MLKNILICFLLICSFSGIFASAKTIPKQYLIYDSAKIEIWLPSKEIFNEYYADRNFNYGEDVNIGQELGFWLKLWLRLGKMLQKVTFLFKAIPLLFKILFFALAILFLYILITKTKLYRIFYSNENLEQIPYTEVDMMEPVIDIDGQIESEIRNQNFRIATRLMFIKLLHLLDKKQFIVMAKGKTNHDYKTELSGTNLVEDFGKSVSTYEYVWYGNFQPDRGMFESLAVCFTNLFGQLSD